MFYYRFKKYLKKIKKCKSILITITNIIKYYNTIIVFQTTVNPCYLIIKKDATNIITDIMIPTINTL